MKPLDLILDAIERGDAANILPDLRVSAPFARNVSAVDAAEARARTALTEPIPQIPWSKFRLFKDTGNRSICERPYFVRRSLLADFEFCMLDGRDADGSICLALEDLIWAICDECTWALPAHVPNLVGNMGSDRPMEIDIDLFASETGFYLAEVLHLLGDKLDPRVVTRCRNEIKRRILDSYLSDHPAYWWERGTNNWGAVCAGSVGMTFLYEETDPARRRAALARVLATMDAFLNSFPPDGTCEEGVGYWEYGFGFFALFADFVHQYTGGEADLFDDSRARRIALFPQSVALSPTRTLSFADGGRFSSGFSPARLILRRHYGEGVSLANVGESLMSTAPKPANRLRALLWADPTRPSDPLPDATTFLPDAQWLIVRHAPFAFAALFGNNGVPHNHNDIGSFLLVDGDEEGPMDLGAGEYTRQYFSPERYTIFCNGAQGHSVPIVGGALQKAGGQYRASGVSMSEANGEIVFTGDIAGAYGLESLTSLRRTFRIRPEAGETIVTDAFAFNGAPLSVTERFVGYAKAELVGPGEARFGAFKATFDPALKAVVHTEQMSTHGVSATTVYILDIEVPAGTAKFEIAFSRRQP